MIRLELDSVEAVQIAGRETRDKAILDYPSLSLQQAVADRQLVAERRMKDKIKAWELFLIRVGSTDRGLLFALQIVKPLEGYQDIAITLI